MPLVELRGIPERAVLVAQQDELTVAESGGATGIVQQHQRQ